MFKKVLSRLSLLLAGCIALMGVTYGQLSYIHMQHNVRLINSKPIFTGTMYASRDFSNTFGFSSFTLVSQNWAEILIGPYYKVNDNLSIGVQFGIETYDPYIRTGLSLSYISDKQACLMFLEKGVGKRNYWYSLLYEHKLNNLATGALLQRFYGVGPVVSYTKNRSTIRLAPLYDLEEKLFKPTLFFKWVM